MTTDFDKWLYILKNLSKLLERPAALRDRIFSRLFDVAEYASLDNIDKQNYAKAMTIARDTHNQIEYAKEIGHEEGREERNMEVAIKPRRPALKKDSRKGVRKDVRKRGTASY